MENEMGNVCAWMECDNPIVRRANEEAANFKKRKYCGKVCAARHREYLKR